VLVLTSSIRLSLFLPFPFPCITLAHPATGFLLVPLTSCRLRMNAHRDDSPTRPPTLCRYRVLCGSVPFGFEHYFRSSGTPLADALQAPPGDWSYAIIFVRPVNSCPRCGHNIRGTQTLAYSPEIAVCAGDLVINRTDDFDCLPDRSNCIFFDTSQLFRRQ